MQKVKIISGSLYTHSTRKRDDTRYLEDNINRWIEEEKPKNFTVLPLSVTDGSGTAYATIVYEEGEKLETFTITVNEKKCTIMSGQQLGFLDIVEMAAHNGDVIAPDPKVYPITSFRVDYQKAIEGSATKGTLSPGQVIEVSNNLNFTVYGVHNL